MTDPSPARVLITGGQGDLARELQTEFRQRGLEVLAPGRDELNVRDEAQIVSYIDRAGPIDILIANAGLARDAALTAVGSHSFEESLHVNLRGPFLCARAALKTMIPRRRGHIILVGSRVARIGSRGQSAYAAAKAGLFGLGQSLAREYGSRNIRCNVVLPGFLETKMTAGLPLARREEVRSETTLGRFNTAENAARFIAFLAELDHVSGQVFTLDSRVDPWT